MRHLLGAVLVSALATGCGPFVPVVRIGELPAGDRAELERMPSYRAADLAGRRYATIGQVEGFSCKELIWSPEATQGDAERQVKHWARQKGANAIANLSCGEKEGVSLAKNCWETIRCTADAIRIEGR